MSASGELRQHASELLRLAEDGERIEITDRGRPIAVLSRTPYPAIPLERLRASGDLAANHGDLSDLPEPLTVPAGTELPSSVLDRASAPMSAEQRLTYIDSSAIVKRGHRARVRCAPAIPLSPPATGQQRTGANGGRARADANRLRQLSLADTTSCGGYNCSVSTTGCDRRWLLGACGPALIGCHPPRERSQLGSSVRQIVTYDERMTDARQGRRLVGRLATLVARRRTNTSAEWVTNKSGDHRALRPPAGGLRVGRRQGHQAR